jgi:hypothetical protein
VAAQKGVIARRASADEVRPHVQRAAALCTTGETLESMLADGECWVVEEGGAVVAGWSQQWQGSNLHVLLYGGRAEIDLSLTLNACLEAQRPASASFQTRRRGLMKKAEALGYRVVRQLPCGVVMKKDFV